MTPVSHRFRIPDDCIDKNRYLLFMAFEGLGSPFTHSGCSAGALTPRTPSPFIPGSGGLWR